MYKVSSYLGGESVRLSSSKPYSYYGHNIKIDFPYNIGDITELRNKIISHIEDNGYVFQKHNTWMIHDDCFKYIHISQVSGDYFPTNMFNISCSAYAVKQKI
jgi:hypothetical protein